MRLESAIGNMRGIAVDRTACDSCHLTSNAVKAIAVLDKPADYYNIMLFEGIC